MQTQRATSGASSNKAGHNPTATSQGIPAAPRTTKANTYNPPQKGCIWQSATTPAATAADAEAAAGQQCRSRESPPWSRQCWPPSRRHIDSDLCSSRGRRCAGMNEQLAHQLGSPPPGAPHWQTFNIIDPARAQPKHDLPAALLSTASAAAAAARCADQMKCWRYPSSPC